MGYKAVYPEEAIQAHLAFLARRRALRPTEEYRTPTDAEWEEFLGHFERRKVSTGTCGRAFDTPCIHEHSCLRCSMHWPDPAQRPRIAEIRDNLIARIAEAEREGWLGEVEGLKSASPAPRTNSPRSTAAPAPPPSTSACPHPPANLTINRQSALTIHTHLSSSENADQRVTCTVPELPLIPRYCSNTRCSYWQICASLEVVLMTAPDSRMAVL